VVPYKKLTMKSPIVHTVSTSIYKNQIIDKINQRLKIKIMQVKCTSCGASQNIDESQDCSYCGNLIEMQKGKSNFQAITKSEFGNFIMMAETSEEATNYNEAISYYNKILEKDTTYSDAWLGKGNCIIYTSKIGDIRMKEALTYWKNSIKFAEHQEPMQLRVSKEIDSVVQTFFPNILDHYSKFAGLDDSYSELAGRFLILEGGIDFACQICPDEPQFFQTGYDLCEMVINAPGTGASSAQIAAAGSAIFNTLAGNKYSVESDNADWQKANARKKQIKEFGNQINHVKNKYLDGLIRLGVVEEDEVTRYDMPKSDDSEIKSMKNEFYFSLVFLVIATFIAAAIAPDIIILPLFIYLIYYFASLNPRSKKKYGMKIRDLLKVK